MNTPRWSPSVVSFVLASLLITKIAFAGSFTSTGTQPYVLGDPNEAFTWTGAWPAPASTYSYLTGGGTSDGPLAYTYVDLKVIRPDGTVASVNSNVAASSGATASVGVGTNALTQVGTWTVQAWSVVNVGRWNGSAYVYSQAEQGLIGQATFQVVSAETPPTVTVSPGYATILATQAQVFSASVSGSPKPMLQWQFSPTGRSTWSDILDATTNTYTINNATVEQAGLYRCIASNTAGSASAYGSLTVTRTLPQSVSITADRTIIPARVAVMFTLSGSNTSYTLVGGPPDFPATNPQNKTVLFSYTFPSPGTWTIYAHAPADLPYYAASAGDTPVTITVTDPGKSPSSASLTPVSVGLVHGARQEFVATTTTGTYAWSCSAGSLSSTSAQSVVWTAPDSGTVATVSVKDPGDATHDSSSLAIANVTLSAPPKSASSAFITPATPTVALGGRQVFTATTTTGRYAWSCSAGTLTSTTAQSVTWTAPSSGTTATVSVYDPGDATRDPSPPAIANVSLSAPPKLTSSAYITPAAPSVALGGRQIFSATTTTGRYVWSCSAGTLTSTTAQSVTWTAPSSGTTATVEVADPGDVTRDPSSPAAASVRLSAEVQSTSASISPSSATVRVNVSQGFEAVTTTGYVRWSCSAGTLSFSGTTLAPGTILPTIATVSWRAPEVSGTAMVSAVDPGDATHSVSAPAKAWVTVEKNDCGELFISPPSVTVGYGNSYTFSAGSLGGGPSSSGLYFWSCSSGTLSSTSTKTVYWTAPSSGGSATISVIDPGNASWNPSIVPAVSTVTLMNPSTAVINPASAFVVYGKTQVFTGTTTTGRMQWRCTAGSLWPTMGSTVTWTAPASGESAMVYLSDPGDDTHAMSPWVSSAVTLGATLTRMTSLAPVASSFTDAGGRTYDRLWQTGSTWNAYLGRSGLRFVATGQGTGGVRTFELQAKSPAPGAVYATLASDVLSPSTGPVSHTFSGLMLDQPSSANALVPASYAAGAPLVGVWTFRARLQDAGGVWSGYSSEVPVTVALPIVVRTETLQSYPPVGPEGAWLEPSDPKTFSLKLWVP